MSVDTKKIDPNTRMRMRCGTITHAESNALIDDCEKLESQLATVDAQLREARLLIEEAEDAWEQRWLDRRDAWLARVNP
jgi:hypothetical protein